MATQYYVASGTVNSRGKSQVTVEFEGRTVTRHLIDGIGRHPDDNLPKRLERMHHEITTLQNDIAQVEKFDALKGDARKEAVALMSIDQSYMMGLAIEALPELKTRLALAVNALAVAQHNNPLRVRYTV